MVRTVAERTHQSCPSESDRLRLPGVCGAVAVSLLGWVAVGAPPPPAICRRILSPAYQEPDPHRPFRPFASVGSTEFSSLRLFGSGRVGWQVAQTLLGRVGSGGRWHGDVVANPGPKDHEATDEILAVSWGDKGETDARPH